jgi:hypothetical protein
MSDDKWERTFHRPQWSGLDEDGTITMSLSVYSDEGHASCIRIITRSDGDYAFWRWLIEHPGYQRTLNEEQLNEARDSFALESGLA